MSSSAPIHTSSLAGAVSDRRSKLRLPSPAIVIALLLACLFLLRLPSALLNRQLNVDESQWLCQAMKFMVDPRPWKAVDPTTSGPFTSYLISIFLLMGFRPTFVLAHMLASLLACLQVLVAYLTLRRLRSEQTAALGAFLMVLVYGLTTQPMYLHYASEWLPSLLLMVGFYVFLVWLDEPASDNTSRGLCLLFSAGLALGAAPWCKLQAGPITAALGLLFVIAVFRNRRPSCSFSARAKELAAFSAGAILTTCVMLVILIETGAIRDFWSSYILHNVNAFAGPFSLTRCLTNSVLAFVRFAIHFPLPIAIVVVGSLLHPSLERDVGLAFRRGKWAFAGLLAYAGAALFAVARVRYPSLGHTLFLVPPLIYLAASLFPASSEIAGLGQRRRSPFRLTLSLVLVLAAATITGIRYDGMLRGIRQLESGAHRKSRTLDSSLDAPEAAVSGEGTGHGKRILADLMYWTVDDSYEPIAAAVDDIQKTHQVASLAIWGWEPGVYVLTGMPPATRDAHTFYQIGKGPLQRYYQDRFVGDLRANPPDLFIDAVADGTFEWWGERVEDDGYESDPALRKFIDDNYVLVDKLRLVHGAKPVRFFLRRATPSR